MTAATADPNRPDLTGTRAAGLARLHAYLPRAGRHYAVNGHLDHGPERRGNVPALSPWLRFRLITPEEAAEAVRAEHGAAARAFETHLAERADRRARLEARPELWRRQRLRVTALFRAMEKSPTLLAAYEEAVEGRTGIEAFDAWAGELTGVGWLHPEARRAFASLWTFSLRLPWELGCDLFARTLVDAEASQDLLLWREVAGLEPGGPPFIVTVSQIAELSAGRFHPRLALIDEHARPLPPEPPGASASDSPVLSSASTAEGRVGLLLTEEDLSEALWTGIRPIALASLSALDLRSPWPAGERARAFGAEARADASARAATALDLEAAALDPADWTRSLLDWARQHDLDRILTGRAPLGPVAERLAAAMRKLEPAGVRLALRA